MQQGPYDRNRYKKGAHTVLDLQYHFVWKTKYGYPVLLGDLALGIRAVLREICVQYEMTIVKGNIRANHIHMLVSVPSHMSVAKIAQILKGKSSYLLQRQFPDLRKKYWGQHIWSRGYFCATVGAVTEETIKQYIENQSDKPDSFKVWDEKDHTLNHDLSSEAKS
jgi:putative transposase